METVKKEIENLLSYLSRKERGIIERRFGLYDQRVWTFNKISREVKLSRERVRQILKKSINKCVSNKNLFPMFSFVFDMLKRNPKLTPGEIMNSIKLDSTCYKPEIEEIIFYINLFFSYTNKRLALVMQQPVKLWRIWQLFDICKKITKKILTIEGPCQSKNFILKVVTAIKGSYIIDNLLDEMISSSIDNHTFHLGELFEDVCKTINQVIKIDGSLPCDEIANKVWLTIKKEYIIEDVRSEIWQFIGKARSIHPITKINFRIEGNESQLHSYELVNKVIAEIKQRYKIKNIKFQKINMGKLVAAVKNKYENGVLEKSVRILVKSIISYKNNNSPKNKEDLFALLIEHIIVKIESINITNNNLVYLKRWNFTKIIRHILKTFSPIKIEDLTKKVLISMKRKYRIKNIEKVVIVSFLIEFLANQKGIQLSKDGIVYSKFSKKKYRLKKIKPKSFDQDRVKEQISITNNFRSWDFLWNQLCQDIPKENRQLK